MPAVSRVEWGVRRWSHQRLWGWRARVRVEWGWLHPYNSQLLPPVGALFRLRSVGGCCESFFRQPVFRRRFGRTARTLPTIIVTPRSALTLGTGACAWAYTIPTPRRTRRVSPVIVVVPLDRSNIIVCHSVPCHRAYKFKLF